MAAELSPEIVQRIETIGDEELQFRGWTRDGMRESWTRRLERDRQSPQVGDIAPDFTLERLSAEGKRTGEFMTLSSLRGRPAGLIFGSFT